ncbi:hypothetical protein F4824DRAFT_440720 [Ustulina deusta]|nr:hypothetical protein F4824DRAFT_440720 [Ustulina deusta]
MLAGASPMDRTAAGQLFITVCVTILLHLWCKRQEQVKQPPLGVLDSIRTNPEKVEVNHVSSKPPRPSLEVLYSGPPDPEKVEVDIIAVHGLGSNVDWSWTWQDKKGHRPPVHWLKDPNMLPHVVPHARIIAYNYDSRWHTDAPNTRLELCGEELVESLHNFRTDALERPIIFIAHSLGGLVVLYGLLYADRTEKLKYLPASTVGFAPLGTPFRGTKMQYLAKLVAWLTALLGSHGGIITDLGLDSKPLADKVHAFSELRSRLNIPTTCFFELYNSDYGKKFGFAGLFQQRVVGEESAHISGLGRVPLYTDHFKLNKYAGPDDRSFQMVSSVLYDMCANWKRAIEQRKQITRDHYFMVPFGRNDHFVGRDAILEQLLERVPPSANKDDCQHTAVEGLGGIGKTQIALEAAYRVRKEHSNCSVFWVPAVDLTSFENAYREIGQLLRLPGINDEKVDVKTLVKTGLSHRNAGSWLLIIDNADDLDMLFTSANLASYLPFSRKGSILFTTRNRQVAVQLDIAQGDIITVAEMSDAEANILLCKHLKESQKSDNESMKRLLEYLANLPLAIKQASAYLESNTNVTAREYLDFCRSSNADMIDLLSRQFADRHRYPGCAKVQNPIATTWLISFKHIAQHNPQAANYLKFICFLAEKDIPLCLLPVASKIKMAEAVGTLKAYGFIIERDTPDSFDIHRLVRLVMQSWLREKEEWEEWTTNVVQRLADEYPFPKHENRETWTRYLPHGQAMLEIDDAIKTRPGVDLTANIAVSYFVLAKFSEAEQLFRQTLELGEGVLSKKHPIILRSMNGLANALRTQGKYEEAEKLYRQTLELAEEALGKRHPYTLGGMNNLASVFRDQEKYEEAEKLHRQTLELVEEVLGKKHRDTLSSMNNLANVLYSQGQHEEAEKIYRQTLEIMEEVLGEKHPDTLQSMSNLAAVLDSQGQHDEAEKIHRQTLELREEVLGERHPDTLSSMGNLATVLYSQGQHEEAEKILALKLV